MKKAMMCVLLSLIALTTACSKVPAGYVGVKVYLLGNDKGVNSEELGVGRYWIGINEELYLFPTFSQNYVWTAGEDTGSPDNEAISFQTVEGMSVTADIGVTYAIQPDKVTDIFEKYRKGVDEITDIYLRNMVRDALVTVASTRKVDNVYGAGKAEMMAEVEAIVRAQVESIGINVERIYWVGNLTLPREVTTALNAKIQATQMAEQRRNEVEQAKAEAQKARETAQGTADAMLTIARAEAEGIELRGEALRNNPDVITLNAVEKWNGVTPQYMGGGSPIPFMNIK